MKQDREQRGATRADLMDLAWAEIGRSLRRFDFPRCSEVSKALLKFVHKPTVPNEESLFELIGLRGGGKS